MTLNEAVTTFAKFNKEYFLVITFRKSFKHQCCIWQVYRKKNITRINIGSRSWIFTFNCSRKWHNFLCNASNKTRLFTFLPEKDDVLSNIDNVVFETAQTEIYFHIWSCCRNSNIFHWSWGGEYSNVCAL